MIENVVEDSIWKFIFVSYHVKRFKWFYITWTDSRKLHYICQWKYNIIFGSDVLLNNFRIDYCNNRGKYFDKYSSNGFSFSSIRLKYCFINPTGQISSCAVLFAQMVVDTNAKIIEVVIINLDAFVEHDCDKDRSIHIAVGSVVTGSVSIGESRFKGMGLVVKEGMKIECNRKIGAGSVILNDLPNDVRVAGIPAKTIKNSGRSN